MLLLIAATSTGTLFASRVDHGVLSWVILLGCPVVVALLAGWQRQYEAPVGRILLTTISGIAMGQVLSVVLGPRVVDVQTFDSLSYFFLTFGIPVIVALCLIALVSTPFPEDEDE